MTHTGGGHLHLTDIHQNRRSKTGHSKHVVFAKLLFMPTWCVMTKTMSKIAPPPDLPLQRKTTFKHVCIGRHLTWAQKVPKAHTGWGTCISRLTKTYIFTKFQLTCRRGRAPACDTHGRGTPASDRHTLNGVSTGFSIGHAPSRPPGVRGVLLWARAQRPTSDARHLYIYTIA